MPFSAFFVNYNYCSVFLTTLVSSDPNTIFAIWLHFDFSIFFSTVSDVSSNLTSSVIFLAYFPKKILTFARMSLFSWTKCIITQMSSPPSRIGEQLGGESSNSSSNGSSSMYKIIKQSLITLRVCDQPCIANCVRSIDCNFAAASIWGRYRWMFHLFRSRPLLAGEENTFPGCFFVYMVPSTTNFWWKQSYVDSCWNKSLKVF